MINTIKIGTRKSKLALIQTNLVIKQINRHFPNISCEIVPIITSGDLIQNKPLYDIGGKALFLKEIEQALLDKKIDLAVHSLKDVPGIIPEDLSIAAVLEQEDSRDVFVCMTHKSIEELPQNAVIGTSSVRRKLCIQRIRPDLKVVMFRGNVDSRINKLINKEVDATVLAYAGLKRLGAFNPQYCHLIKYSQMLPCIGQGVIGIEARKNDHFMLEICKQINHLPTFELIKPGRAFLEYLDANCRTPIGAYSRYLDEIKSYDTKINLEKSGESVSRGAERTIVREHPKVYKDDTANFSSSSSIQTDFMLGDLEGNVTFHTEISNTKTSTESGIQAAKIMLSKLSSISGQLDI